MRFLYALILTIIPTITYATDYSVIYPQQNVIKRHVAEFDADTFIGLKGYYGVMDAKKLELNRENQLDAETVKTLIDLVKILLERQAGANPVPPPAPTPTQPEPPKVDNLDTTVFNILNKNCASCHSDTKSSGGLKLVTKNGLYNLSAIDRFNVYYRSAGVALKDFSKDLMPLNGTPLQDEDVQTLYKWAVKKMLEEKGK